MGKNEINIKSLIDRLNSLPENYLRKINEDYFKSIAYINSPIHLEKGGLSMYKKPDEYIVKLCGEGEMTIDSTIYKEMKINSFSIDEWMEQGKTSLNGKLNFNVEMPLEDKLGLMQFLFSEMN